MQHNVYYVVFSKAVLAVWNTKKKTERNMNKNSKTTAFTLAEVLITFGIIGVVAAVSLPTIITNINERRNSEREANIAQKMTQAMEHMRALGKLTPYATTEDFVNELKNHIKISKICDKDHLTECWPTTTVIDADGNEYNVADAKTGAELGNDALTTNNVGLRLADGASIILNYDNRTEGYDVGSEVREQNENLPVGGGKTKNFPYTTSVTDAIRFVMDVNGKNKPNRESIIGGKFYDIRSFRGARFSPYVPWENGPAGKILYIGRLTQSQTVDCSSSKSGTSDYQKYCGNHPSGSQYDYWAGAQKTCEVVTKNKGVLANVGKLQQIQSLKSQYTSISSNNNCFWSPSEHHYAPGAYGKCVQFSKGSAGGWLPKYGNGADVVCAAN